MSTSVGGAELYQQLQQQHQQHQQVQKDDLAFTTQFLLNMNFKQKMLIVQAVVDVEFIPNFTLCNNPNIRIILFSCILVINKSVSYSICVHYTGHQAYQIGPLNN